jgi:hypothetical protein
VGRDCSGAAVRLLGPLLEWLHTELLGGRPLGQPRVVGGPAAVALHLFGSRGRIRLVEAAVLFALIKLADSKRMCCWSKVF